MYRLEKATISTMGTDIIITSLFFFFMARVVKGERSMFLKGVVESDSDTNKKHAVRVWRLNKGVCRVGIWLQLTEVQQQSEIPVPHLVFT